MTPAPLLVSGLTRSLHLREQDTLVFTILSLDCIYQASIPGASPCLLLESAQNSKQPALLFPAGLESHHPSPTARQNKTPSGDAGSSAGQKKPSAARGALSVTPQLPPVFSHSARPSPSSTWGAQGSHLTIRGTPTTAGRCEPVMTDGIRSRKELARG